MPSDLRSSGQNARPSAHGLRRMREAHRAALAPAACRSRRASSAEHQARELGAARAEQAGDADDLAVVQVEVERVQAPRCAPKSRSARRGGAARSRRAAGAAASAPRPRQRHVAAHHRGHQRGRGQLARRVHSPTKRPLRSTVMRSADRVDLVEEVRDEQDRQARVRAARASRRTGSRPRCRRGWRWARRGSAPWRRRSAPGRWRPAAARPAGSVPSGARRVDVEVQAGEQGARLAHHARAVDGLQPAPAAARVAAREDVLRHREVGAEVDLLVDGADAQLLRGQRGCAGAMAAPSSASAARVGRDRRRSGS